jgi:hypothetical protein
MSAGVLLLVAGISAWVYFDARAIGVRKGLMPGPFDMTPLGWAGLSFLLWIVWFPVYLSKRSQLRHLAAAARANTAEALDVADEEPPPRQADDTPSAASHAGDMTKEGQAKPRRRARKTTAARKPS